MANRDAFICDFARTPIGRYAGSLSKVRADDLGAIPIRALVERKSGTHIFLSYSRHNLALALQIRNALEDAGHTIWPDTTAIKGSVRARISCSTA